jgi:hypothetical protein
MLRVLVTRTLRGSVLCFYMKITHRKARSYVEDLLAKFEDDKNSVMLRLKMLGWTQREISEKLQELWPDAKGTSLERVNSCLESCDDNFSNKILDDLAKGHPVETVAGRHARSPEQDSYRAQCALRWLVFVCQFCAF